MGIFRLGAIALVAAITQAAPGDEIFEKQIRPVLVEKCQMCHNGKVPSGGLNLTADGYKPAMQNGLFGAAENPEQSPMLMALRYESRVKMPPQGKLPPETIAAFKEWIAAGSPWPGAPTGLATRSKNSGITDAERKFWAFQPLKMPAAPPVKNSAWAVHSIDRFVLGQLEAKGWNPAPPADKLTLLRRATFDLTGLPPSEQEIRAFLADNSADAFAKVVDRLLASPRYGERWGRHWLDVARYADSTGSDEDHRYPHAWRYRDYVVKAFNADMPYDRFLREQLAGDILASDPASGTGYEGIVATGFLALGKKALAQKDLVLKRYDVVDDQIDVTGKAILGMTVACARCHDHKFDPIQQKDYYALAGIFASTLSYEKGEDGDPVQLPLAPQQQYTEFREKWDAILKLQDKANKILDLDKDARKFRNGQVEKMKAYMLAAHSVYSGAQSAEAVAAAAQLDGKLLAKWVSYLRNKDAPELAKWHATATDAARAEAAEHYAVEFKQDAELYDQDLSWWSGARKSYPKAGKLVGPRPAVRKEATPFFRKVWLEAGGPLYRSRDEQIAELAADKQPEFRKMLAELADLEKGAPTKEIPMACAVKEGPVIDQHLFVRGNHQNPGEVVPKSFLRVIAGEEPPAKLVSTSGRLDLANWLVSPDHPLTARVMANRIWQWHFGEGLVRTPDNFGKLGEAPTHPELLDYLARTLVDGGWSIKKLHREIMLSATYRMGGITDAAVQSADPENRLLSHFPKRRLSIEELRDSMLAISGELDPTMGGTLDPAIGTDGETSADRISMSPDKTNRRSLYLPLRRSNLPNLFSLYDFGDATNPEGKRGRSIVPTQALFLMNSQFVARQASVLATQLMKAEPQDSKRVERAYLSTLARPPKPDEVDMALSYIAGVRKHSSNQPSDAAGPWQSLCRVLLASNEFVFVY